MDGLREAAKKYNDYI